MEDSLYVQLTQFVLFYSFSPKSLTKTKTEHKSLPYIIIKDSRLLFLLTLFLTAEGTGQIYSLWHSNQFSSIFLRGFSSIHCPRISFLGHQCENPDLFWPAKESLPRFISSLLSLQSQNWNVPQLKIILNWTIVKFNYFHQFFVRIISKCQRQTKEKPSFLLIWEERKVQVFLCSLLDIQV